jgi:glutamyl-Q tRNA(Asp) synthetase
LKRSPAVAAYRGRFAPTSSGPLHLGSLLTALGSWLQARAAGGAWLLRIDDLDTERCRPGHAGTIQRQLEAHGLLWDEPPRLQSGHVAEYQAAFERLQALNLIYPCACTRTQLARDSLPGIDGPVYAGICRGQAVTANRPAWRLHVGTGELVLNDPWQGRLKRDLQGNIGDFVLKRADGQIGYQLACVVDEAAQGITEVVRGADLIGSSFRQLHLQSRLGLPSPAYRHLPVLAGRDGRKLSKQNHARPIDAAHAALHLYHCLELLNQAPPPELRGAAVEDLLRWGLEHWQPQAIPAGVQHAQAID